MSLNIFLPRSTELGLEIRPKIEGVFEAEIRRADGRIEKPWDGLAKNAILNDWRDQALNRTFSGSSANSAMIKMLFTGSGIGVTCAVGTSDADAAASARFAMQSAVTGLTGTYRALAAPARTSTGTPASGNAAIVDASTGNAVLTRRFSFDAEAGPVTYREATVIQNGTNNFLWPDSFVATSVNGCLNRLVFPAPISLGAGDALTLTFSLVIPTLAVTGQTVSLAAQNGMDLSGTLRLIGSEANILGGTVTAAGVPTPSNSGTTAGAGQGGSIFPGNPRCGLTTASTFPTALTNTTGMNANPSDSQGWSAYAMGSFFRDFTATWNSASGPFTFRSVTLYLGGGTNGYQLLLNADQTKATGRTLVVNWRFAL
jgi:hypothetical protein